MDASDRIVAEKAAELAFPIYETADTPAARTAREIKAKLRELHVAIALSVPPGREACNRSVSLALTELETAGMYAVKAIHQAP